MRPQPRRKSLFLSLRVALLCAAERLALAAARRATAAHSDSMFRPYHKDTRHVSLARVLHTRLYMNGEGRIFSVGGRVVPEKLREALSYHERCPNLAKAPSPRDLGVSTCDGELSQHLLHCLSRALNRWRKELTTEIRRRPAKRRSAARLAREQEEIERLTSRLQCLRRWKSALADGNEPPGAPFFLDAATEATLEAAVQEARREHPLTPVIAWQARVVYWLSGERATRRFLSATTQFLSVGHTGTHNVSDSDQLRSFQQAVVVWKERSANEPAHNLRREMALHIERLPRDLVSKGRLSARPRGRTFQEHCALLQWRSSQLLARMHREHWHLVPAALAALAAADGSALELPHRYFRSLLRGQEFGRLLAKIQELAEQIGRRGTNRPKS